MKVAFCGVLLWHLLLSVNGASPGSRPDEKDMARSERTFGPLLPLSLSLFPLMAPLVSKTVFFALLSGIAYLVFFVGSFVFPSFTEFFSLVPESYDPFTSVNEDNLNRIARAVQQGPLTTEAPATGGTTQCRRRFVCEMAKAVSDGVPSVPLFDNFFRNRTANTDSYAGAWANGWLGEDCSVFYKDCDTLAIDSFSSIVALFGGPQSYIGSLLTRFTNTSTESADTSTVTWLASTVANIMSSTASPVGSAASSRHVINYLTTSIVNNAFENSPTRHSSRSSSATNSMVSEAAGQHP